MRPPRREDLGGVGYLLGWRVVRLLPEQVAYAVFDLLADLAWWRRVEGVRRLEANLARARPELDAGGLRALSRAGMRSYLRYWCDAFRLPGWSHERLLATVRTEDEEPVRAALAQGRGVVMALAHQGNWDAAGGWSALALAPVTTVAERLRPDWLYRRFTRYREALGIEVLGLGGPEVFPTLLRRLRAGGFVPLLADRDLTARGVEVLLLGEPARMAAGPAALALATGAALHPVTITYERLAKPGPQGARWGVVVRFHAEVVAPSDGDRTTRTAAMVQACADALGQGIREHPEDWHMLQPVFLADLDPARLATAAATSRAANRAATSGAAAEQRAGDGP